MRKEGTLGESSDVQVVSCILNEPVADSQFDLDFPPGTFVIDRRKPRSEYLIRPDGTKRIITNDDQDASYEELVASESGMAKLVPAKRPNRTYRWLLAACVTLIVLGCVVLWLRRKRAPSAP
jgi:hypothetical protein